MPRGGLKRNRPSEGYSIAL
uniref:Uncharacterized protein n=1 Tax=Anguilla anguilla TaxID=7936 RepID=A0A0E9RWS9_ANGAN